MAITVINSGVKKTDLDDTKEFKRLLNGISLLGLPICLFYVALFTIKGYPEFVLLFTIGIPLFLFPIIGSKRFGFKVARYFLTIAAPIFFLAVTVMLGRESGFYLGFLVITVPPILFFRTIKAARPFVGFGVLCFALSFVGIGVFNPDKNLPFAMMIYIINLIMVLSTQIMMVTFFKNEISENRLALEEKNKEITDSINYAKRIQAAILPSDKIVKSHLKDAFVLYKPKDIVAGDFYWIEEVEGTVLFAAADCTGHGVPGAMVSVICNNALNRSVREYGLIDPGVILDKACEIVIQEFEKSEEDVKDGMDIALCALKGKTLHYSGANNPLWILRNGEIIETKATKQPVGKFDGIKPYKTHAIELQQNDIVYVFSDGYVDQFGGERAKKFKANQLRSTLLSIAHLSMSEQHDHLDKVFIDWQGDLEQIDDVCVIGIRID